MSIKNKDITNNVMVWVKPIYHRNQVNRAGDILINKSSTSKDMEAANNILNNWRVAHSFPMNTFRLRLNKVSKKIDSNALVVQRLKREPAIINKLKRFNTMKLSQMQDISGCRSVVSTVQLAQKLSHDWYEHGELKHKLKRKDDYISNPKESGYRSIHLIYEYDSHRTKTYNGLIIEVQIRSKLQHLWATAVETVDLFTRQAIKSNKGKKEWIYFFKLMSCVFAQIEETPTVPNINVEEYELYTSIKKIESELRIIENMKAWTSIVPIITEYYRDKPNTKFFLLELDITKRNLAIIPFKKSEENVAILKYAEIEKRNLGDKTKDVVLVGANTIHDLEKAYPNYFANTTEFLEHLQKYLDEKNKKFNFSSTP